VHTYTSGGSAFQSSWRVNDPVLVEGANLNNGFSRLPRSTRPTRPF
jgi:hypothetical protein